MSRRRRHGIPVSLFPFVAVMAATMGALILLLLVISRQSVKARDAAWKRQQEEIERRSPELPPLPGLAELPTLPPLPPYSPPPLRRPPLPDLPPVVDPRAALVARKAAIEKEIAELQTKRRRTPHPGEERLAPLAREAALLRDKLRELLAERERAKQAAADAARRKEDLVAAREKRREQLQRVENRYAVTPYLGPNGTPRRPIYLECRADHVVLQPEGVRLGPGALARPHDSRNPLAEMLNAVGDALPADGGRPYPLLLVRPDGVETYYRVREALEFLKYSVGYELIPAEMELAFPAADPTLKGIAESAVVRAQQRLRRPRGLAGGPGGDETGGGDPGGVSAPTLRDGAKPGLAGDGGGLLADAAASAGGGPRSSGGRREAYKVGPDARGRAGGDGKGDGKGGAQSEARVGVERKDVAAKESSPKRDGGAGESNGKSGGALPQAGERPARGAGGPGGEDGADEPLEPEPTPRIGASIDDYVRRSQAGPAGRGGLGSLWVENAKVHGFTDDSPAPAGPPRLPPEVLAQATPRGDWKLRNAAKTNRPLATPLPGALGGPPADAEGPFRTGEAPGANGGMGAGAGGNTARAARYADALDERRRRQAQAMTDGPAPFDAPEFLPEGRSDHGVDDGAPPLSPSGGLMLQRIANADQPEAAGAPRRLSAYDPLRLETGGGVERAVTVRVRAGSATVPGAAAIPLPGEDENDAARKVLSAVAREVGGWSREPTGRRWRPAVRLQVAPGGAETAWRLRLALALAGVPTTSVWCAEGGAPLLDWSKGADR